MPGLVSGLAAPVVAGTDSPNGAVVVVAAVDAAGVVVAVGAVKEIPANGLEAFGAGPVPAAAPRFTLTLFLAARISLLARVMPSPPSAACSSALDPPVPSFVSCMSARRFPRCSSVDILKVYGLRLRKKQILC